MLVILDKDGTLVKPISGKTFVQAPDDQQLISGVLEQIVELKSIDAKLVIVSNQGGVAANHKTLESTIAEMRFCLSLLPQIQYALFCTDFDGYECFLADLEEVLQIGVAGIYQAGIADRWDQERTRLKIDIDNSMAACKFTGSFRKPSAGMLNLCIDRNSTRLDSKLMIGDRVEDRDASIAAGISFIDAVAWRNGERRDSERRLFY